MIFLLKIILGLIFDGDFLTRGFHSLRYERAKFVQFFAGSRSKMVNGNHALLKKKLDTIKLNNNKQNNIKLKKYIAVIMKYAGTEKIIFELFR